MYSYFYIFISILCLNIHSSYCENATEKAVITVLDAADIFVNLFSNENKNTSKRIKDLQDKLSKIDSYVIDRDKYAELIKNTIARNNLNQTNFYKALLEEDHFRLFNSTKCLYLKLKEKMNMDDIMKILSERGDEKTRRSARRMATQNHMLKRQKDKELADIVDKYLAQIALDEHKFDNNMRHSNYWDPKIELEERQMHHQLGARRIFHGERTNVQFYPFVVSIHLMGQFWCGGSLFSHDMVITSAACLQLVHNNRFYRENPLVLAVRVGSNHSRVGGEMVEALEVYFHPSYNPQTLENNVALIRLRRKLKISYHRTPKLIALTHNEDGIPFTAEVLLLGWGVSKTKQKQSFEPLFLQSKILPIYPATFCKEIYGTKFNPRTMFCAGTMTTGEGACSHDAGGPAVLNGKLVGIISYGPTICGFPDAPTVMTMIGFYADWIETINETMPGYYRVIGRTTTTKESPLLDHFSIAKATTEISEIKLSSKVLNYIENVQTSPYVPNEIHARAEYENSDDGDSVLPEELPKKKGSSSTEESYSLSTTKKMRGGHKAKASENQGPEPKENYKAFQEGNSNPSSDSQEETSREYAKRPHVHSKTDYGQRLKFKSDTQVVTDNIQIKTNDYKSPIDDNRVNKNDGRTLAENDPTNANAKDRLIRDNGQKIADDDSDASLNEDFQSILSSVEEKEHKHNNELKSNPKEKQLHDPFEVNLQNQINVEKIGSKDVTEQSYDEIKQKQVPLFRKPNMNASKRKENLHLKTQNSKYAESNEVARKMIHMKNT